MSKDNYFKKYQYSDQTVCIIGPEYNGECLIASDKIRWHEGELYRAPSHNYDYKTATFEFPTLELGGYAFQSIVDFDGKKVKDNANGYPFGAKYLYARMGTPQHEKLSAIISYLERVPGGVLAPSGVAASHLAVLFDLPKGATVLHSVPIYDCTRAAQEHIFSNYGIQSIASDFGNLDKLEKDIKKYKPYKLYLESPANPTMIMVDLPAVYKLALKYKIKEIIVDNTFASPILQKPIEIMKGDPHKLIRIVHSGTKFFTGGMDGVCWGYVSLKDWSEFKQMLLFQKDMGYNMSSIDADAVLHHGIPTLYSRVKDQSASAWVLAKFLQKHPLVKFVNYPGLEPFKQMADKYYTGEGYGSILYFEFDEKKFGKSQKEALEISEAFGDILGLQSFIWR